MSETRYVGMDDERFVGIDEFLAARLADEHRKIDEKAEALEWAASEGGMTHNAVRLAYASEYADHDDFRPEWRLPD